MMNRATLIGHVGADSESGATQSGTKWARFRVATSERWKDKATGEKKQTTEWHSIVVWNEKLVPVVEQYVKKGTQVCVEGKITTRKWQDKQGQDRYTTEIGRYPGYYGGSPGYYGGRSGVSFGIGIY